MTLSAALLILFCVFAEAAYNLCFKKAADGAPITVMARRPLIWLGVFFWAIEIVAWVCVLQKTPLSLAFPTMALVYIATMAGGVWILGEKVTPRQVFGALLITLGVALIGLKGTAA